MSARNQVDRLRLRMHADSRLHAPAHMARPQAGPQAHLRPLPEDPPLSRAGRVDAGRRRVQGPQAEPDTKPDAHREHREQETTPRPLQRDIMEDGDRARFLDEAVRPDEKTRFSYNPEGLFFGGGPSRPSGLTGRKNAIDTYGEYSRHSGAAL